MPGTALIETLPVVWQMVVTPASWQLGRALATGADMTAAAITPAVSSVVYLYRIVMALILIGFSA
ncbi:MAG: hypothetical protein WAM92_15850 [Mycobacterium sp.]